MSTCAFGYSGPKRATSQCSSALPPLEPRVTWFKTRTIRFIRLHRKAERPLVAGKLHGVGAAVHVALIEVWDDLLALVGIG